VKNLPPGARRESFDIFDDDDNINPKKRKQSEGKIHRVYEKNNEKGKSFLDKVGDAIALLHGKALADIFRHVVNSLFNNKGVRNVRGQSGENLSTTPASSFAVKDARLSSVSDSISRKDNIQPKSELTSELTIEAYFNSYFEHYRQVVEQNSKEQLVDCESPSAKLYAEHLLKQVDSEMKSNPQYSADADESERVAAAAALLVKKNPLAGTGSPTQKQYLAFEKWHANRQLSDKNKFHPQTQSDLSEAKIYAKWFLENKYPTFNPESVEAKKEKSAKYLIENFAKISDSYAKKESAPVVDKNQNSRIDTASKNNELLDSDFYLVPQESNIPEKKISPEKKPSQRDVLIREYKDLLGIDPDKDMQIELIQELINERKRNNSNEAISPGDTVLEYDSEQDDEIPMDDDSEDENDRDFYRTENNFLNGILENTSNNLPSSFNDGSSSQSNESLDSRMAEWRRDNLIINAIRSENEEMLEDQRAFDEAKKNAVNLTDLNRDDNRPTAQASDALESEFPLPTSLFVDKKLGPPPPPPPPRNQLKGRISKSKLDAASVNLAERVALKNFPIVDLNQLSKALTGADAHEDFNSLVYGAEDYFDSLASNSDVADAERIKAVTLAKIWEGAAQENRRLSGMKALKDYALLNALLNSEKISKDFENE
jgi:hypothetical protein